MPAFIFLTLGGIIFIAYYLFNGIADWYTLFVAIFILYLPVGVYRTASKNYKSTKALHEEVEYIFTEENITVTGQSFNSAMQWQTLYKVRESKELFLLWVNKQMAMIIPKSAFSSESDINTFRTFWSKHFPQ